MNIDPVNLTSIAAVIAATMIIMAFIKPWAAKVHVIKSLPTWLFTVSIATALTLIAHYCLKTLDGDTPQLVWASIMGALGAIGTRNAGQNFLTSIEDSAQPDPDDDDDHTTPPAAINASPISVPTLAIAAVVGALTLVNTGCATSQPFKTAVKIAAPTHATIADTYIDNDSTLDAVGKTQAHAWVTDFRNATTQPTFESVYDNWLNERNLELGYSERDPKLAADPIRLRLRLQFIDGFDDVVEHERQRRMIWYPFTTPATPLPRVMPTTLPSQR